MDQMHEEAKREVLKQLQDFVNQLDLQNLKGPAKVEMEAEIQPEQMAELDPEKAKSFEGGFRKEMKMDEQPSPSPSSEESEEPGMLDKLKEMYESIQG